MPKVRDHEDPRVMKAVKFKIKNPNATVPEAMLAKGFSPNSSKSAQMQMLIRRRLPKAPPTNINVTASPGNATSSVSTLTTTTPAVERKLKRTRKTSKAAQQQRQNNAMTKQLHKQAHKKATLLYASDKTKPRGAVGKLSANKVSELIQKEHKIRIAPRTIQQEVKDGRAGLSPVKQGRPSNIPDETFDHMADAFGSFIRIQQLNGQSAKVSRKKLKEIIKQCTTPTLECDVTALSVRLFAATAAGLNSGRNNSAEERRVKWTTYFNLKRWFDNWERDLVKLGFAQEMHVTVMMPSLL
jgi:hypothetical protein